MPSHLPIRNTTNSVARRPREVGLVGITTQRRRLPFAVPSGFSEEIEGECGSGDFPKRLSVEGRTNAMGNEHSQNEVEKNVPKATPRGGSNVLR
jgi:hypothetical protein